MIRRMEIDDILVVVTIENACFSDPWTGKILEESLKTPWNYFWIALDQGKAVGYGALCLIAGEGEIQRIAVLPEARKRGIGKKLLELNFILFPPFHFLSLTRSCVLNMIFKPSLLFSHLLQ